MDTPPWAHALTSIEPDAPLDDLAPLRVLVGDARVVAVGEGRTSLKSSGRCGDGWSGSSAKPSVSG